MNNLSKVEEEFSESRNNNDIELSSLQTSSIVSQDYLLDRDLDEEDEDDNEFHVKITQETFMYLLQKGSDALMVIGGFLLICFWIADSQRYNFLPFDINRASNWWYQFAQIIFLASWWATNIILLRTLSIMGYLFFIIWAISVGGNPSIDFYLFTIYKYIDKFQENNRIIV